MERTSLNGVAQSAERAQVLCRRCLRLAASVDTWGVCLECQCQEPVLAFLLMLPGNGPRPVVPGVERGGWVCPRVA